MFKTMNDKAPIYLSRQFSRVYESNPCHILRGNNSKLILPLPKTENLMKSFKYSAGAVLWNSLPEKVTSKGILVPQ